MKKMIAGLFAAALFATIAFAGPIVFTSLSVTDGITGDVTGDVTGFALLQQTRCPRSPVQITKEP